MRGERVETKDYGLELFVIRSSTGRMDETTGDAGDEKLVRDDELDDAIELLPAFGEQGIQFFSLGDGAREPIQNKAAAQKETPVSRAINDGKRGLTRSCKPCCSGAGRRSC